MPFETLDFNTDDKYIERFLCLYLSIPGVENHLFLIFRINHQEVSSVALVLKKNCI